MLYPERTTVYAGLTPPAPKDIPCTSLYLANKQDSDSDWLKSPRTLVETFAYKLAFADNIDHP